MIKTDDKQEVRCGSHGGCTRKLYEVVDNRFLLLKCGSCKDIHVVDMEKYSRLK